MTEKQGPWTTVIRSDSPWFDLRLRELWSYRDLVALFVRRDFVAQYKQTVLGPLWHIVQPLLITVTFTIVFGRIARISTDGLPPFLFYLSGTIMWGYFSNCFTKTSTTFISNANVFGRIYFPRMAIPVSLLLSGLVAFFIQFLIFLGFLAFFIERDAPVDPSGWVLATPLLLVLLAGLGLGGGIIVSALTTRYRDLTNLVQFGVTLLMYMTPVVYPLSTVPQTYQTLVKANPLTPIVEAFRFAYLGSGSINPEGLLYSATFTLSVLICGILLFNRVERTFMDTV